MATFIVSKESAGTQTKGTYASDVFEVTGGSNTIAGESGFDTVVFSDSIAHFSMATLNGITHVKGNTGALSQFRGTDTAFFNIEQVNFLDAVVPIATSSTASWAIVGTSASEKTVGTNASDVIDTRGGSDQIDGGAGDDTLVIFDTITNFSMSSTSGITHVKGNSYALAPYKNTDTILINMEYVQFTDRLVPISGNPNQNDTFNAAKTSETIDGGAGIDTVIFNGTASGTGPTYTITNSSGSWVVANATEGAHTLLNIERLQFTDTNVAIDISGTAGQIYRLYNSAFHRTPDSGGFKYWMNNMDNGMALQTVATAFVASAEFTSIYGANLSGGQLINALYYNVLHRTPDQGGYDYWLAQLNSGAASQASLLVSFSESAEGQANIIGQIGGGIWFS